MIDRQPEPMRSSGNAAAVPPCTAPSVHPIEVSRSAPMKQDLTLRRLGLAAAAAATFVLAPAFAQSSPQSLDVGSKVPDVASVKDGLFPEDACKELEASGFKCMGLKPAIRYSLPASSFKVGSAELPELLKKQLDVFADVLRGKKGSNRQIRVVGHADASGTPEANQALSLKRAESVKEYLIEKGADPAMLMIVGLGSKDPANPANPNAAENRRVVIGRDTP
jgi:OOP family OmpA-OmpF porin